MPNHITNIFDVTGTPAKVKAFKDKVYRVEKAIAKYSKEEEPNYNDLIAGVKIWQV